MPPAYRVIIQPRASADIVGIATYIEQASPQNASSITQKLLDAIDSLNRLPHRYKVYQSHRVPGFVVRSMPVWPFIVYYQIAESRQAVVVLAVIHGARRQPRSFN
jgi:toxin ParE1/3/4